VIVSQADLQFQKRVAKYLALIQGFMIKKEINFSEMEQIVGKLVSLECAVSAGMWFTREQYAALRTTRVSPDASKKSKTENAYSCHS